MMTTERIRTVADTDEQLVEWSRTGDREAFGRIVERYQALVCSITYGATGSLGWSEDLAQETFLTAWKRLAELREPAKLRSWLCGITRNLLGKELRRRGHEPVDASEPLDAIHESPSPEPLPSTQAVSREEEAILWRALERIPETFREPLILFYREQQSVKRVAEELELSEDAVKQRLSRGRKLLTDEVAAFVEGTLQRTTPGKAFTVGVLAALPVFATSAKAAVVGATAAKGSAAGKAAGLIGLAGAILGPVVGILGGMLGTKMSIENTQSSRERQFMVKMAKVTWTMAGLFCVAVSLFVLAAKRGWNTHPVAVTSVFIGVGLGYTVALAALIVWGNRTQRRIRQEETAKLPTGTLPPAPKVIFQPQEYRSRWTLLGLPLVHVCMECKQDGNLKAAKGWVAVGNVAYGVLFACGGFAVAPVSVGGAAVGLVALGGCAAGLLSFAGLALGVWAAGGAALGYVAFGGGAMAWLAASGGSAVAHEFAVGGAAFAQHANDEVARAFMQNSAFFTHAKVLMNRATFLIWLPVGLMVWQFLRMQRRNA
jgi:RNA polymerase sigma factor (sigma-70 family)